MSPPPCHAGECSDEASREHPLIHGGKMNERSKKGVGNDVISDLIIYLCIMN